MDSRPTPPLNFPRDTDGFLRRRCPGCHREFKWQLDHPGADRHIGPIGPPHRQSTREKLWAALKEIRPPEEPVLLYHCPYCDKSAEGEDFTTPDQQQMLASFAKHEAFTPGVAEFAAGLARAEGRSETLPLSTLPEANDMRLVTFACHPDEPVKVAEDYRGPLHCLVCGEMGVFGDTMRTSSPR
jgi:hypothetical protein